MSAPAPVANSPPANSTAPPPATPSAPPPSSPTPPPPPPPSAPIPSPVLPSPPPPSPSPPPPQSSPSPPPASPSPPPPTTTPPPTSTPSPPPPVTPVSSPPPTPTSSPPSPVTPGSSPPPPVTPAASPPSGSPVTPGTSPPPPVTPGSSPPPPVRPGSSPPPPKSTTLSPPPPHSVKSPPPPPGTPSPSSGVPTAAIIGITAGVVGLLFILAILFFFCCKKRKRDSGEGYYPPPPPAKGDPQIPQQHWQQNAPPPSDHMVAMVPQKLNPPPGYNHQPLPPLPPHYSSGGSSSYSGSENPYPAPSPGMSLGFSKSTFTYEELRMATNGFSDANLLGQGGFGYVHKGVLPDGKEVAIKQLKAGSGQGEREFQAEVEIISRVHHKHLVTLVGYCITGTERLLVYEFVPNNTMEFHLHGKGRPTMDWPTRLRIALGSAKGLAYLHEDCHPKIIHRDIKAANILLDLSFEAKVADFGLAKIASELNTHVSTRVMGTFGYLAPEYASSGKLTEKSDVFSFGVMLLELITGRKPVDTTNTYMDESLVDWARPQMTRALEDGNFDPLVDPKLQKSYNHEEMARMIACAAACVRHSARRRAKMSQVVRALEGNASLSDLNEGVKPGHSSLYSSNGSTDYDKVQYKEELKKFREMAFASEEQHGSSEYSEGTSEYGVYPSGSSTENTREIESRRTKRYTQGFTS